MQIEGRNAISELLRSGQIPESCLIEEGAEQSGPGRELARRIRQTGCKVTVCPRSALDRISGGKRHQGFVATVSEYAYATVEELFSLAEERGEAPFFVMLCGVEDPHNLGSVVRVAECAGVHGVILPKHGGCAVTPTVVRVSAGAVHHVKIARVTNLNRTIEELKARGVWVYAADMGGEPLFRTDLTGPVCLVIGGEGSGVPRLTAKNCDRIVSIPMSGKVNSLNASVAAGVIIYETVRQRNR